MSGQYDEGDGQNLTMRSLESFLEEATLLNHILEIRVSQIKKKREKKG